MAPPSDQIDPNHEVNQNQPCIEHKKNNIRNNKSSFQKLINNKQKAINDDALTKNTNRQEHKQVLTVLKSWSFTGAEFIIKQYGIEKIKELIEVVKTNNPTNKGGYLRALLNCPDMIRPEIKNIGIKNDFNKNDFIPESQNNNKTCEALEHIQKIKQINDTKPTKEEIIQKLLIENPQEAIILKKLWKM